MVIQHKIKITVLNRLSLMVFAILLFSFTLLTTLIFISTKAHADEPVTTTTSATASVNVSSACTLSGGNNNYVATLNAGTTTEFGGSTGDYPGTPIKAVCNDAEGYALYAIGFSGNSYTAASHTHLIAASTGTTNDITTKASTATTTDSYWAMKLTPVSGPYAPTIRNDASYNYTTYEQVPSTFTKVASLDGATDLDTTTIDPGTGNETTNTATGSSVYASYVVDVDGSQTADTYSGAVKYTLVHPNTMVAGTFNINFLANGGTGTMTSQTGLYNFEDNTLSAFSTGSITPPTGYQFAGWCTVQDQSATSSNPQTTCTGTNAVAYTDEDTVLASTISASGSESSPAVLNLYAYYSLQTFTCNQQYRLQNADGTWGEYMSDGSTTTTYGGSCTYTKEVTDYKDTADGTNDTAATTTATNVTSNQTLSLDFYRNTYALTVNKNDTALSTASATTTPVSEDNIYRWGQDVNISATANTGYHFTTWSQTAGTTGSFADNTAATTTFTMPKSNATIYANGAASTYTITLNQNGATTSGTTSVNATYNSSSLSSSITNPSKSYSISGFTMGTAASGASVTWPASGVCTSSSNCKYTYAFGGWYNTNASTGGTQIITTAGALTANNGYTDSSSKWISTSNPTIYARWAAGTSITLPSITKTGYTCGWSESSTATSYTYQSGYSGLTLTGNKTLYGICVIKSNLSLKVSFDSNVSSVAVRYGSTTGTLMGTVTTSGSSVSGLIYNANYYLIPTYKSGYQLNAWSKDSGTVGTLSSTTAANPYYRIGDGSNGVTLSSKSSIIDYCTLNGVANADCMQKMTSSNCTTTAKTVTDSRDGEKYKVQRLTDGKCWMLDNLRLGGTSTIALTPANTNITSNFTLPAGITSGFNSYTAPQINVASKNNTTTGWGNGSKKIGVYYNFCAASAGTICTSSNSSNASHDICPAGWRLPVGGWSTGEFQNLVNAYGLPETEDSQEFCGEEPDWCEYIDNGSSTGLKYNLSTPLSGYFLSGSAYGQGSYGYFWSSTRNNNSYMYFLDVDSSYVRPSDTMSRYVGYSVRCVAQ